MSHDNPFAKLGALEQKLYQDTAAKNSTDRSEGAPKQDKTTSTITKKASMPAIRQDGNTESQHASNTAKQQAGKPENQQTGNTANRKAINPTEKVTYRFHPDGKYAVEDMKTILERQHGVKTSLAEIVEEAVLLVYEDLLTNKNASKLASRLARNPESQKTS